MYRVRAKFCSLWATKECFDLYHQHMTYFRDEDSFVPKHHLTWHLLARIRVHGNPTLYATWLAESDNKKLKDACRLTSQLTFEASVLTRMQAVQKKRLA